MLTHRLRSRSSSSSSLLGTLAVALLLLLSFASSASAAEPATVTVRVEGLSQTLIPPTQVTTTTTAVVKNNKEGNPEGSCPGTSAAGALELATGGNWSGKWYGGEVKEGAFMGLGYSVETIAGESYPFTGNYFWDFWLDNKAQEEGICSADLKAGDQVLLFPCYYEEGKECPTPLGIEAPSKADVGEAVAVTVKQYNPKGEEKPAVGATVSGGGVNATTDSQGHATLKFSGDGTYTLHAVGSGEVPAVRAETNICVHEGDDGTCGTALPGSPVAALTPSSATFAAALYKGPFALVAQATGVLEGHVYRRGHAPRLLAGKVLAHTPVTSVSISLRRSYHGVCYTYNGTRERLQPAGCGKDSFFKVADGGSSFSYLLPAQLPPGRYVLDTEATDAAGNHTALARGSSRFVFYVR
jgi:hypothetical protein